MSEKVKSCPLCSEKDFKLFEKAPSTSPRLSFLSYLSCENCGLVFLSPRLTEKEMEDFYLNEFQLLQNGDRTPTSKAIETQKKKLQHLADWVKDLKTPKSYLDIGCSSGQLLKILKDRGAETVVGIEPGLGYRNYVRNQGFPVFGSLEELLENGHGTFDLISMSHVLEHLSDPIAYLKSLKPILSPKGTLLIEVPNVFGHYSFEIAHNFAFSEQTLRWTLASAGFEVSRLILHSLPDEHASQKHITVFATISKAPQKFAFKRPRFFSMKLKRQWGLIQAAALKQKPRAIAGILKRSLSQYA